MREVYLCLSPAAVEGEDIFSLYLMEMLKISCKELNFCKKPITALTEILMSLYKTF